MPFSTPNQNSGVIVVVEDPLVSRFVGKVLERAGYPVLELDPQPALNATRSGEIRVKMLITNIPHVFAASAADVPLLYLAAEPNHNLTEGFRQLRVLQKPFLPSQLLGLVNEMTRPL